MHHESFSTTATHDVELPDLDFGCNEAAGKFCHVRFYVLRRKGGLPSLSLLGTSGRHHVCLLGRKYMSLYLGNKEEIKSLQGGGTLTLF